MNFDLLKVIISELENFQKTNLERNVDLDDFRNHLNETAYKRESPYNIQQKLNNEGSYLDNEICKLLLMMGRYAKFALRKGLENYPELINEDFTYLYRLSDYPYLTKMQLIEKNAHDKQYGLVIIKRLLQHKLIQEETNPNDRREKFVSITKNGQKLVEKSFDDVSQTAKLVAGNLDNKEKEQLLNLLKKLSIFHHFLYDNHRDTPLHQINKNLLYSTKNSENEKQK